MLYLSKLKANYPTLIYSRLDVCKMLIGQKLLSVDMGDWIFLWFA